MNIDANRITRAAEMSALPEIRSFVKDLLARHQVADPLVQDVLLAIEEAAMNVIGHGYEGLDPGSLMVDLDVTPGQITAMITDFGHPFEPRQPEAPDVEGVLAGGPEQGFGLFLIHRLMDAVDYRSDELGNHLILTKRR